MNRISFKTKDLQTIQGFFYPAALPIGTLPIGTLLIASALGVPQQYYKHYAAFMAEHGYQCVTFDYRGTGLSEYSGSLRDIELSQWGSQDLEAAITEAKRLADKQSSNKDVFLVGHSIGGQILGLANNASELNSAIFIASSAPFWGRWPYPKKLYLAFVCHILLPAFSFARDMYPARAVGLSSMDLPATCARDWGRWMRNKDYLFGDKFNLPRKGYLEFNKPLLSLAFSDDEFAPKNNVDHLLKFFDNASIENELIHNDSLNLGAIDHMGFFKKTFRDTLWQKSLDWINVQNPLNERQATKNGAEFK